MSAEPQQAPLMSPEEEIAFVLTLPDGAYLSPAAQTLYEQQGAARFAAHHRKLFKGDTP